MKKNKCTLKIMDQMTDMHEANRLIQQIWGEDNGITPYLLMAHSQIGGFVLGAYSGDSLMGISYGFPAVEPQGCYLYSHLLAVHPAYRNSNIGGQLKAFQAQSARQAGYRKLKWTFDPLESKNAYLNLHKLRAESRCYKENFYGKMNDLINGGSPSDRLIAEWDLEKTTQPEAVSKEYADIACVEWDARNQIPMCAGWNRVEDPFIRVPVPSDIHHLKKAAPELSLQWRLQVREMLQYYLQQGFLIHDFGFQKNRPVQYYLLKKEKCDA